MEEEVGGVTKTVAVTACTAMTLFYVAILYAPTLILRLPPPTSFKSFMVRRFICAGISSIVSLIVCALILPVRWEASYLFGVYGIQLHHIWQAVIFPLSLTSLMYAGSMVLQSLLLLDLWKEHWSQGGNMSLDCRSVPHTFISWVVSIATSVSAWRNYFVAPLTEELVFRACMIPLLLCGGFNTYAVVFLCPIFFSIAHLNHLLEFYTQQNRNLLNALMVVGFQLGYTVIFGSYASFLFIRTGHLIAPVIAHIFCNFMGLPVMLSRRTGMVGVAFIAGMVGFLWLLFPLTSPDLYNGRTENCKCWHRYCTWS
ncbi:unnamed protein product [Ilex paraguariensis]|uniref:intramembrane prenyl-peptidase Rce1 n=1 Tax=Ilex paraguariensis TaxID=185542 RepID=A0ABC8V465_9AQUA